MLTLTGGAVDSSVWGATAGTLRGACTRAAGAEGRARRARGAGVGAATAVGATATVVAGTAGLVMV